MWEFHKGNFKEFKFIHKITGSKTKIKVLTEVKHEEPQRSLGNGTAYRVVLNILSIFGNCPLSYNVETSQWEFSWLSWRTCFVLGTSIFGTLTWIGYSMAILDGSNLFLSQAYSSARVPLEELEKFLENNNEMNPRAGDLILMSLKLVFMIFALSSMIDIFFGWRQAPALQKFLNNWTQFEIDYSQVFPRGDENRNGVAIFKRIGISWRIRKSHVKACLIIGIFTGIALLFPFVRGPKRQPGSIWEIFAIWNISLRLLALGLIVDIKNVFMYQNMEDALEKIKLGIIKAGQTPERLRENEVEGWRKLIDFVHSQCRLASEYQKPTELFFVARCIVTTTIYFFCILSLPSGHEKTFEFILRWGIFCFVLNLRMYVKCWRAEQITLKEAELGQEIVRLNTTSQDLGMRSTLLLQIMFVHDLLSQKHCKINFGNYVTLNKQLLLRIFGQVVTYIIVVMQFIQSK